MNLLFKIGLVSLGLVLQTQISMAQSRTFEHHPIVQSIDLDRLGDNIVSHYPAYYDYSLRDTMSNEQYREQAVLRPGQDELRVLNVWRPSGLQRVFMRNTAWHKFKIQFLVRGVELQCNLHISDTEYPADRLNADTGGITQFYTIDDCQSVHSLCPYEERQSRGPMACRTQTRSGTHGFYKASSFDFHSAFTDPAMRGEVVTEVPTNTQSQDGEAARP